MVVTWVTQDKTKESKVRFGQSSLEYTAEGHTTTFVDGGSQHRKIYIHRARLHGLKPGESYGNQLCLVFISSGHYCNNVYEVNHMLSAHACV